MNAALRKIAVDLPGCDAYGHLVLAVKGMEVRWCMVAVVHGDHDSEEATDLWHVAV